MKKRWLIRLALLAGLSFMLGFSYDYHLPKIEAFLLIEVERQSQLHSPIRVYARKLHFHLFPLGIVLEDVRLLPKAPLNRYLAPAHLKEVGARLALWPLLRGDVRLNQIFIRDSELNVFLKEELFESKGPRTFKLDFEEIYRLPIDEILLERVQIQGKIEPQNVVFRINDLNLLVENRYQSLFTEIEAPLVQVKPSGFNQPLNVQLELRALLESEEAQISAFKMRAGESFVVASGRFNGDLAAGRLDNGAFDARAKLHLEDVNIWEDIFSSEPRVPKLKGFAEVDLGVELRKGAGQIFNLGLNTRDVKIDKFTVGSVSGEVVSDLKTLTSSLIEVQNSAGKAKIEKLQMELEPKPKFKGNLAVVGVELKTFLENIGIKNVPLSLLINGDATCDGSLKEPLEINCNAKVSSPRVHVHSGKPKESTIVDIHDLRSQGSFKVTGKDVQYKADLQVGKNSAGTSDGIINYETGFKINYDGKNVDFADVKNLANLKFEGQTKITGSTQGTSAWATIDMVLDGQDFWLEDYPLGQLKTKVRYKSGLLYFDEAHGQFQVSRYNGQVQINLRESQMKINAQIPFADLKDIQAMFQRKLTLPFQVAGTGTGSLEASGPFAINRMTYTLKSSFFRGEIARETFDELLFNVKAVDGLVQSERIQLTKATGVAEIKGQITPQGVIDTVAVARQLRVEQSENVLALGLDMQGLADLTVLIRGQLPKPKIELNGRLSRVVLGDQPAEDSVFKLTFLEDRMSGSGQFLGSTMLTDFVFPYDDKAPFSFKLKTDKWDFTTAFSLVSKSARQLDFTTSVSMDVNLQSAQGGFWASDGQMKIDEFVIRKGGKQMAAEKPMQVTMRSGVINSNNFAITSGDSYLKLDLVNLRKDLLNASVNGKVDLSLLGLFTPFISDLRGYMAVSMDFRGSLLKPSVSGSAYIDRGYAKFADFYHPFSNVRADVLFNDNQILLNAVRADMAGGKIAGDGKITFEGDKRPVDVKGTFTDVKLNVPEGFRTRGSGTVAIRGPQFPYTMDISYLVTSGEVISEFGGSTGDETKVKASAYLPRFLHQESFHPFTFLVDVAIKNSVLVNNSMVQAQVSGAVKASGVPDRLLLDGTLTPAVGGKVFFGDVPFEITSGYVEYDKMPPENPKIYLTATTRVTESVQDDQQRSTEHQYDINLLVQGRAQPPQISLTSQPPLSHREIVSLLALGVTATGMDQSNNSDQQAGSTSSAIGAAILQKAGGRRLKDSLGVDVKVSSSQPTPDNASTPKVTLSKQWTPKFGASASSTLQANPSNQVKLEYKMNKNLSVIGSWDGKETNPEKTEPNQNVFGLDLEYKVQFK